MKGVTTHKENLANLKRIGGQIKGIQRMIEEGKYCIDIVNQIHAAVNALYRVSEKIIAKHIEGCVVNTFKGRPKRDSLKKIDELMSVIRKLHNWR